MKRKNYITILRVISAIAVVFVHTNCCFGDFSYSRYWLTAAIFQCLIFFAVPVFFMVTGATLIDYQKKYSTKEYFKKRFLSTVVPFLVWNTIGFVFLLLIHKISVKDLNVKYIFEGFLSIDTFVPYFWFFITLFSVYLCIPVLSSIKEDKKKSILTYLAIGGAIFNILIPFICNVFHIKVNFNIDFVMCSGFLVYPIVGYLLDQTELTFKKRLVIYIFGIIGLLMHLLGTVYLSYKAGALVETFSGYWNIPCLLYAMAIFVFVKSISERIKSKKFMKVFDFLSKYTFPIYLLHFFVLEVYYTVRVVDTRSIYFRLGFPFVVIPVCILIAWLIRKIPFVKKIMP